MNSLSNYVTTHNLQDCEIYFTHYDESKFNIYMKMILSTNIKGRKDRMLIIYDNTNIHILLVNHEGNIIEIFGVFPKKKIIKCDKYYVLISKNYLSKVNTSFYG